MLYEGVVRVAMTYGIEWNSKPSRGEEVGLTQGQEKGKGKEVQEAEQGVELLDLPTEILVLILHKMGYEELRSMEQVCSYFRYTAACSS